MALWWTKRLSHHLGYVISMVKNLIWLWPLLFLHLSFHCFSFKEVQSRAHMPSKEKLQKKSTRAGRFLASHPPWGGRHGCNGSSFPVLPAALEIQEASWHFPRGWLISGEWLRLWETLLWIAVLALIWNDLIFNSNISMICHVVSHCKWPGLAAKQVFNKYLLNNPASFSHSFPYRHMHI